MSDQMTHAEKAVNSIAQSLNAPQDPAALWFLSALFLFLALLLTYYYIREKFILKRRFQPRHKPDSQPHPPIPPMRFRRR